MKKEYIKSVSEFTECDEEELLGKVNIHMYIICY